MIIQGTPKEFAEFIEAMKAGTGESPIVPGAVVSDKLVGSECDFDKKVNPAFKIANPIPVSEVLS